MTDDRWKTIKHFTKDENWGDSNRIAYQLVQKLDDFRDFIKQPMIITCGTQGVHVENSFHYKGLAADVVFPEAQNILDIFFSATRFNFGGIGVYPHWKYQDKACGGLHLDVRYVPYSALWLARIDNNKQTYVDLSLDNLKALALF